MTHTMHDRRLCLHMLLIQGLLLLTLAAWLCLCPAHATVGALGCAALLCGAMDAALWRYMRAQEAILTRAAAQIDAYLAGDRHARLEADEEGALYRLFHAVNTLAAVLEAHADNAGRAKRFLRDTIADISHQLKTPLAALNIYVGLMQQETDAQPQVQTFLALAEQELDRIAALVQSLLKMAKLDAGAVVMERREVNVSAMMQDLARQFVLRCQQEGKTLQLCGAPTLTLCCDRVWLTEALGNLIKNALDHTKSGGEIALSWSESASAVKLTVKDNGSGIHPEDLYHIFKRFYRSRFSSDTQGVGLGLPLAKAVIEAHGGTLTVESTLGVGTTMTALFLNPTAL